MKYLWFIIHRRLNIGNQLSEKKSGKAFCHRYQNLFNKLKCKEIKSTHNNISIKEKINSYRK